MDFSHRTLSKGDLAGHDFRGMSFKKARIVDVDFTDADLTGADFSDARIEKGQFKGATCINTKFCGCELLSSVFDGADLNHANFSRALLRGASFSGASCLRTSFVGADCSAASFFSTVLWNSNFSGAILHQANFENAILRGIDLSEARLWNIDGFVSTERSFGRLMPDCIRRVPILRNWPWRTVIRDERERDFQGAADVYYQLRQLASRAGQPRQAAEMYYRWRCARRKALKKGQMVSLEGTIDSVNWVVTGYGEKLARIVTLSVGIIFTYALIYSNVANSYVNDPSWALRQSVQPTWIDWLAYSAWTFTLLGYGYWDLISDKSFQKLTDLSGGYRWLLVWLPASEAFVGAVALATLGAMILRKVIRE